MTSPGDGDPTGDGDDGPTDEQRDGPTDEQRDGPTDEQRDGPTDERGHDPIGDGADEPNDVGGPAPDDVEGPRGFVDALVDLLREIADDRGSGTRSGIDRIGGTSVDFSITAGSLAEHFGPPPLETDVGPDPYVVTRETPDGCVVVADLGGVASGDVSTRVDDATGHLVIAVGDDVVGRVALDDPGIDVVDARLNNDVLEVRLAREH